MNFAKYRKTDLLLVCIGEYTLEFKAYTCATNGYKTYDRLFQDRITHCAICAMA